MLRQRPLPEAVEAVLEHVDLALRLAVKASPAQAQQIAANLRRVCEIARAIAALPERSLALSGATGGTLENLLVALDRAREAHTLQRATGGSDAVQLVTIHGAKGLEYPIVVLDVLDREFALDLPRLEIARPDEPAKLLSPEILQESCVRLVPAAGPSVLREQLAGLFGVERNRRSEWLRLLYVAVTRAREHLLLLWPAEPKGGGATRRVKDLLLGTISQPPTAAGEAGWSLVAGGSTHRVRVWNAVESPSIPANGAASMRPDAGPSELRHLLDQARLSSAEPDLTPKPAGEPPRALSVTPTELCRVADCPEVPRLVAFHPGEHRIARLTTEPVDLVPIVSARAERDALGDELDPVTLGQVLHRALEGASLRGPSDAAVAAARLLATGLADVDALEALAARFIEAVSDALKHLGATEVAAQEAAFAVQLDGVALQGSIDLVARGPTGLHVLDLKAHLVDATGAARWAGYYRPQLDAYAVALARLTNEPIAGRHLILPAAGLLVTLRGRFDAEAATRRIRALADLLAAEASGPGPVPDNDCACCTWRSLCRVGRASERVGDQATAAGR
jgi:ATP-dependent exoDNAse (exonuclease V) beta subunit